MALTTPERRNAGSTIDIAAIAAARIEISRLGLKVLGGGIEVDIQHTGGAAELQLAGIAFPDIEPRGAELPNEIGRCRADHAF